MGKLPELGVRLPGIFAAEEALAVVERVLSFYRAQGQKNERLARTVRRVGEAEARAYFLGSEGSAITQ
jgi:dissimilatory sulfite reductase (desulfoviridin) alpha/beta subunit